MRKLPFRLSIGLLCIGFLVSVSAAQAKGPQQGPAPKSPATGATPPPSTPKVVRRRALRPRIQNTALVPLAAGLKITRNQKFAPGEYLIPNSDSSLSRPVITIEGSNLSLDFSQVVLRGSAQSVDPNTRQGLGILIKGTDIKIKNLKVHGYKVAVLADKCSGLTLENCDFSYNWKDRLKSTTEKEDLSDWMSFHQNEKDEWLRYGAGIYLRDVVDFEIKQVKIVGGQCGLMMVRSSEGKIYNNNFSFLSAIGIGMYRSSRNLIQQNNIDWCVRGYSDGVYNRGQDSAGILVYEQSDNNTFAYNSVTHGGDGFFLWAGQSTMDTGKGGCNDNLVYGNDFSFSPTNGIEATFSRNKFSNNLLRECWHGFWTGYSFDSLIANNVILDCEEAIAHEHGNGNTISNNVIGRNKVGVHLWANATQDPNWGYPKSRNTRSENWTITGNVISGPRLGTIVRTDGVKLVRNLLFGDALQTDALSSKFSLISNQIFSNSPDKVIPTGATLLTNLTNPAKPAPAIPGWVPVSLENQNLATPKTINGVIEPEWLPDARTPFIDQGQLNQKPSRGRSAIIVDEWGPFDFKSPKLWPAEPRGKDLNAPRKFNVFGPKGRWKVKGQRGILTSTSEGTVPGTVELTAIPDYVGERVLVLEYVGVATTNVRGQEIPAGKPVDFGWKEFDLPIAWTTTFFGWQKDTSDPRTQMAAYEEGAKSPITTVTGSRLDYAGYGKFVDKVPATYFGTKANGTFKVPLGDYVVDVTADDGVRVWVDEKLVIDAWKYQGPTQYTADLKLGGTHKIRVEHFQIDGYSTLKVAIKPKSSG